MNKLKVLKFLNAQKQKIKKHSPEILTGIGIAGVITTVVLAVKATPKAMELIEEERLYKEKEARENGVITEDDEKYEFNLTPVEIVKVAWKPYIPAAVTGVASIACIIGASSVNMKRNAALATAYQLSTTALSDYREKVVETIGEKKEIGIRDKVAKKKVEENPVKDTQILVTGRGDTLCYDANSDRYFKSDIDKIRNAVLDLNERMINGSEMYISLNEFYDAIGLKHTDIGESIGWRIDRGKIDVRYSAVVTENNDVCIVIDHLVPPEYGYRDMY